jgi:hypothetical protein
VQPTAVASHRPLNCDQVATKLRLTGRDQYLTSFTDIAVEQDRRVRQGITREGAEAQYKATDLAVGSSNPSRRANKSAGQRPCHRVAGTVA